MLVAIHHWGSFLLLPPPVATKLDQKVTLSLLERPNHQSCHSLQRNLTQTWNEPELNFNAERRPKRFIMSTSCAPRQSKNSQRRSGKVTHKVNNKFIAFYGGSRPMFSFCFFSWVLCPSTSVGRSGRGVPYLKRRISFVFSVIICHFHLKVNTEFKLTFVSQGMPAASSGGSTSVGMETGISLSTTVPASDRKDRHESNYVKIRQYWALLWAAWVKDVEIEVGK